MMPVTRYTCYLPSVLYLHSSYLNIRISSKFQLFPYEIYNMYHEALSMTYMCIYQTISKELPTITSKLLYTKLQTTNLINNYMLPTPLSPQGTKILKLLYQSSKSQQNLLSMSVPSFFIKSNHFNPDYSLNCT